MKGKKEHQSADKADKGKKKQQETQEPQYYRSATGEETLNYRVYYMSALEKTAYFFLAFIVGAAVGLLFYGGIGKNEHGEATTLTLVLDAIIALCCGFIAGKMFLPIRTEQIRTGRQKKLRSQFRDMLEALTTSLNAGSNVHDAFLSVETDLKNQYEEGAFILQELSLINSGVANGFVLEDLLADFGRRSGIEDISNFADVFQICYRQGGNIKRTLQNTTEIITDKMSVEEEIETVVSGSKNEQYIMLVMPMILVGMIKMSSADFASNFTTVAGLVSTTIGVVLFITSYLLGRKLLEIKI